MAENVETPLSETPQRSPVTTKREEQVSARNLQQLDSHSALEKMTQDFGEDTPGIVKNKSEKTAKELDVPLEFYPVTLPSGEPAHVIFKAREETIPDQAFDDSHIIILGKDPAWIPKEDYEIWKKQFDGKKGPKLEQYIQPHTLASYAQKGGLTFVVNQDIEDIAELALLLGANDPEVRRFYHEARTLNYSNELEGEIDKAIAARIITDEGEGDIRNNTHDGEALLLASFLGDQQAKQALDRKVEIYHKISQEGEKQEIADRSASVDKMIQNLKTDPTFANAEPLKIGELATVHTTKFYPTFNEKLGRWVIKSSWSASDGYQPRDTIHFTLNHVVTSHNDGGWDDVPLVIVAPLQDMMEENGKPANLNTIDTFWEVNPGQDLILPESTRILAPGRVDEGNVGETDSPTVNHRGNLEGRVPINYKEYDVLKLKELQRELDIKKLYKLDESTTDEEQARQREVVGELGQEKKAYAQARNDAVSKVLQEMGVEYKKATPRDWEDEHYGLPNFRLGLLANQLGVLHSEHAASDIGVTDDLLVQYIGWIQDKNPLHAHNNKQALEKFLSREWKVLPMAKKRMLWTYGIL